MITRTQIPAEIGSKSSIDPKAEILLLLIITIFGIIGLSFCMGLQGGDDAVSATLHQKDLTEYIAYDQQTET